FCSGVTGMGHVKWPLFLANPSDTVHVFPLRASGGHAMQLNLATLVMLDIYILLLVGVLMLHAWSRGRDSTLGYLAAALLVGALGTLLASLRGMGIDWVPILLGNVLVLASAALVWTSLRVFVGRRPCLPGICFGAS